MQRGAKQRNCPVVVFHVGVGSLSVLSGAAVFSVGGPRGFAAGVFVGAVVGAHSAWVSV